MSSSTPSPVVEPVTGTVAGDDGLGRRERKKQATRRALHEAASALAVERGLSAVTIEDITERADVAPRTFFNYFSSKEEAVLEKEPDRAERVAAALAARPPDEPPLEALRRVMLSDLLPRDLSAHQLHERMRLIRAEPTLHQLMVAHFEEMHAGISAEIARRTGLDPVTSAYPDLVTSAAMAACRAAMLRWAISGSTGDPAPAIDEAFALLGAGLTPPTPAADLKEVSR